MIIKEDSPQKALTPTVGSCYSNGLDKLRQYFLELLAIFIIMFVIGIPAGMGSWSSSSVNSFTILDFFGYLYSLLISGPVGYGVSFAYLKAARGEKPEIKNFLEFMNNYWNAVIAGLVTSIIIIIGFILLIVPGIIFTCKLAFVPYLVIDRKMGAMEAIRESWNMTDGHATTVFLIWLAGIPICIAGLLFFGIGIILSFMWIYLALSSLYHAVSTGDTTPEKEVTPQGPFL